MYLVLVVLLLFPIPFFFFFFFIFPSYYFSLLLRPQSLCQRPFLEMASFFGPEVLKEMFRQDVHGIVTVPSHALRLHSLLAQGAKNASKEVHERIDFLAVRVLDGVSEWAMSKIPVVQTHVSDPVTRAMLLTRLKGLSVLKEFKNQLQFRIRGGYSAVGFSTNHIPAPDHKMDKHNKFFEENPIRANESLPHLFSNTLVLRIRFQGWARVQLATDPG